MMAQQNKDQDIINCMLISLKHLKAFDHALTLGHALLIAYESKWVVIIVLSSILTPV